MSPILRILIGTAVLVWGLLVVISGITRGFDDAAGNFSTGRLFAWLLGVLLVVLGARVLLAGRRRASTPPPPPEA